MVEFEASIEIAASPERVWSVLADIRKESLWMRATRSVAFISGDDYQAGSRMLRMGRFLGMTLRWQSDVTAVEQNRLIAFRHDGSVEGESRWEVTASPTGSRVRLWSTGPAPGPFKWFPKLAVAAGKAGLSGDLARLKQVVERT